MATRYRAAKIALVATAILAIALLSMELLNAPWIGFVATALLFIALIAREVTIFGGRGVLIVFGLLFGVIGAAFVVQRIG